MMTTLKIQGKIHKNTIVAKAYNVTAVFQQPATWYTKEIFYWDYCKEQIWTAVSVFGFGEICIPFSYGKCIFKQNVIHS